MSRKKKGDITIARARLSMIRSYYNVALWSLKFVPISGNKAVINDREGKKLQDLVMAVDNHWRLYYNPDVLKDFTLEQIMGVLVHELNHLLRDHAGRSKMMAISNDNHMAFNFCCDLEINDDIVEDKGLAMPEGKYKGPVPSDMKFKNGLIAEKYYSMLPKGKKPPNMCNCGSGAHGQPQPWEEGGEGRGKVGKQEAELLRHDVAEKIRECKSRGDIPAGLKRWAEELVQSKVDWRRELSTLVRNAVAECKGLIDYSYRQPSRRQSAYGRIIMPTMTAPQVNVSIVLDSSGSMGKEDLELAVAEIKGILKAIGVRGAKYYCVDALVHIATRITSMRDIKIEGGGGTDMRVGISQAMDDKPVPHIVVVITDGYTPWPEHAIGAKMVAVIVLQKAMEGTDVAGPPWAKTIYVDEYTKREG